MCIDFLWSKLHAEVVAEVLGKSGFGNILLSTGGRASSLGHCAGHPIVSSYCSINAIIFFKAGN